MESKYERNSNIIKVIVRAILLCVEQGIALRGHREEDSSNDIERNFLAIIHIFAWLDAVLMEHLKEGAKTAKMVSWQIQNGITKFIWVCEVKDKRWDSTLLRSFCRCGY